MYRGFGAVVPVVTTCPPCSYLQEGSCLVCEPEDPHPGCNHCIDGEYKPPKPPWYKHDLTLAIATGTVIAVASGILAAYVHRAIGLRKK